ncbi:hypothetical protein B0J12DRAFT_789371 [Macrophomina phaseolina]|uniref:Uncharacterized protein n=1 Tax=Macrophomina phaseolina TaxID=35725 RepID=A0ABQ8FWQ3_9PEZI|nr:hypothetical protein B0J12DRAFT_789371 [Macrophomina phaseolina]
MRSSDGIAVIAREFSANTSTTESGSPVKKSAIRENSVLDQQFDIEPGTPSAQLSQTILDSKHVKLPFSLMTNGRYTVPPNDEAWAQLSSLFQDTFGVELCPPFLIIRVRKLPPRQPVTVAGMPLHLTTDKHDTFFERGRTGKGGNLLHHLDLNKEWLTDAIMGQVLQSIDSVSPTRVMWFSCFWQIVIPDGTPLESVPGRVGRQIVYYRYQSEIPEPSLAAGGAKDPDTVWDNTNYLTAPGSVLRPGIMLSSSERSGDSWLRTSSGVLVANSMGEKFVTASTHGFNPDGEVWHPSPKGDLIGKVVQEFPHTGICLIKLNKGITYINETFQSDFDPLGTTIKGFAVPTPPETRGWDIVTMDNPYSGYADGNVIALGVAVSVDPERKYTKQRWFTFQCGGEDINGSCGSPILDEQGRVLSFFRYQIDNTKDTFAIEAVELQKLGFEVVQGQHTF